MTVLLVTAMVLVVLTIDFMLSGKEQREQAAHPVTQPVAQPRLVPAVVGGFKLASNVAYHPAHLGRLGRGADGPRRHRRLRRKDHRTPRPGLATEEAGATMTFTFKGNQVRLTGVVGPEGGWAGAYVDGVKEPTVVECWNPSVRWRQPVFIKKGLTNGLHELKIVARGEHNPLARGAKFQVDQVQFSATSGDAGFGSGGGSADAQRLIFGYTGRQDYVDSKGHAWRPGTEFVTRLGFGVDTVTRCWWNRRRSMYIGKTADPEIYRYGVHAPEFWVNLTTAPGLTIAGGLTPLGSSSVMAETLEDFRIWGNVTARGNFGFIDPDFKKFRWAAEVQPRSREEGEAMDQLLIRPGVGYAVTEHSSLWVGYAHVINFVAAGDNIHEDRAWQQYMWSGATPLGAFTSRSRFEQRWQTNGNETGGRFRQMFKLSWPLPFYQPVSLVGWDEVFIHLNDTNWRQEL